MKVDTMRLITDKITDVELAKKLIKKLMKGLENFKENEINLLLDELEKCEYNELACNLAINQTVLANKTIEDRVKLIQALKKCEYDEDAYNIAINEYVHEYRTIDECVELMRVYKECEYVWSVYCLAKDHNNLLKLPIDEQIALIRAYKECDCNKFAYKLARNENVLIVPLERRLKLMQALKECDYDVVSFKIATDYTALKKKTTDEQITLMKVYKGCNLGWFDYNWRTVDYLLKLPNEIHIKLFQAIKECEYSLSATEMAGAEIVSKYRTIYEHITFMKVYNECNHAYDARVFNLITSPDLLELPMEEHLTIIKTFKECEYKLDVYKIAINLKLPTEKLLKLMKISKRFYDVLHSYEIITNPNLLKLDIEE